MQEIFHPLDHTPNGLKIWASPLPSQEPRTPCWYPLLMRGAQGAGWSSVVFAESYGGKVTGSRAAGNITKVTHAMMTFQILRFQMPTITTAFPTVLRVPFNLYIN